MCPTVSDTDTVKKRAMESVNHIPHQRAETFCYQGVMYTGIHKLKYHWSDFPEVLKSKSRG